MAAQVEPFLDLRPDERSFYGGNEDINDATSGARTL